MSTVDDAGVTSTFSGCVSMEFAKVSISGGIVAEKKRVCRFAGNSFNMRRISCMNPMSSIRSASSNTKNSSAFRLMKPWLTRSCSRPGVATSICTPRFSSSVCGFCPTPPKMTACLSPVYLPYALKDSPICMANSRVGVRMSALILCGYPFYTTLQDRDGKCGGFACSGLSTS